MARKWEGGQVRPGVTVRLGEGVGEVAAVPVSVDEGVRKVNDAGRHGKATPTEVNSAGTVVSPKSFLPQQSKPTLEDKEQV